MKHEMFFNHSLVSFTGEFQSTSGALFGLRPPLVKFLLPIFLGLQKFANLLVFYLFPWQRLGGEVRWPVLFGARRRTLGARLVCLRRGFLVDGKII